MPANNVKYLRKKKGYTQKQLADAVKTSQQQIQRIEAGQPSVKIDLALKISEALGHELAHVFPSSLRSRGKKTGHMHLEEALEKLSERPVFDPDPRTWTVSFQLKSGVERDLVVNSHDKNRIVGWLNSDEEESLQRGFLLFDSGARRYAINTDSILFIQFLFDLGVEEDMDEPPEGRFELEVFFMNSSQPKLFSVEPDSASLEEDDPDESRVQLQDLFFWAESGAERWLRFDDVDGETVYLRTKDVAMISAPLAAVDVKVLNAQYDEDDQSET